MFLNAGSVTLLPTDASPSSALPPKAASLGTRANLGSYATEFESILLGQWLQSAQASFGTVDGESDDADPGAEQMKSFGTQALAKEFSRQGGVGIGTMIAHALQAPPASREVTKRDTVSR